MGVNELTSELQENTSTLRLSRVINSLAYKLTKTNNSRIHQLTNPRTHKLVNSSTHKLTNLPTYQLTNSQTCQLANSQTCKLANSQTHKLANSQTCKPANSQTHQLTTPSTQKLKIIIFILQCRFNFHSVLAKLLVIKLVNIRYFLPFVPFVLSFLRSIPAFCTILPF